VHDIVDLEARGVVGAFVASSEFVDAATAQARALGADPASVFVAHPIQDRTDEELRALADAAVEEILAAVTAAGPPPPS
jgi:alkanesulfonate monooxygenase SsuD/methylene tetrahydromethanopterin reductase-like flavin-dependent oxidoreductase (luciferase family)